jgi:hypothetical protein
MAVEEVVVDEFEGEVVAVPEDNAKSLTTALVFMTTILLVFALIVLMVAMKKYYDAGLFGKG